MEDTAIQTIRPVQPREPWNKGKLVGQKAPFKLKEVWAIRVWLQLEHRTRELALFDLGLTSSTLPARKWLISLETGSKAQTTKRAYRGLMVWAVSIPKQQTTISAWV